MDEAAASNEVVCPPMEYTAFAFYINTEQNTWKMHFNVTMKLNALIQVSLYALKLFYCLQANLNRSKSKRNMMLLMWRLIFSFSFKKVTMGSL